MCDAREGGTLTGYVGDGGGPGESTSDFAALSLNDSRELGTVSFAQVLNLVSLIFLPRNLGFQQGPFSFGSPSSAFISRICIHLYLYALTYPQSPFIHEYIYI